MTLLYGNLKWSRTVGGILKRDQLWDISTFWTTEPLGLQANISNSKTSLHKIKFKYLKDSFIQRMEFIPAHFLISLYFVFSYGGQVPRPAVRKQVSMDKTCQPVSIITSTDQLFINVSIINASYIRKNI